MRLYDGKCTDMHGVVHTRLGRTISEVLEYFADVCFGEFKGIAIVGRVLPERTIEYLLMEQDLQEMAIEEPEGWWRF